MKVQVKSFVFGALLTVATTSAFAINTLPYTGDPVSHCENTNGLSCYFLGLKPYQGNPNVDGAYFHCTPNANQTAFKASDYASLITGFYPDGSLRGPATDLLKYSFGAYEDPNNQFVGRVVVIDQNGNFIPCTAGTGGLPVHPGDPHSPQS